MKIEKIEFIRSSPDLKSCPKPEIPEFAFIGRSNVGKSSLINMLADHKGLAKVSGTPGKTRLINFFKVSGGGWGLVDLPGFGFAKLRKTEREKFEGMIKNYLDKRETLACTFLLIDSRLPAQKIDLEFMDWLGDHGVPFVLLFTKTDKCSRNELGANLKAYRAALSEHWEELPMIILTSAETKLGRDEVLDFIQQVLSEIQK